jgi:hypothetical protein
VPRTGSAWVHWGLTPEDDSRANQKVRHAHDQSPGIGGFFCLDGLDCLKIRQSRLGQEKFENFTSFLEIRQSSTGPVLGGTLDMSNVRH